MASQEGEGVLQTPSVSARLVIAAQAQACGEPPVFLHYMQSRRVSQRR